jgi:RHS repeat-associated protein
MLNRKVFTLRGCAFSIILAVVSGLGFVVSAQGQAANKSPERGFHAGGSYALSEIETISRSSGELSLNIPLGSLPAGRGGLSASLRMLYSSKLWDTAEGIDTTGIINPVDYSRLMPADDGEGSWRYGYAYRLKLKDRKLELEQDPCTDAGGYLQQLVLVTPDGAQHTMRLEEQYYDAHVDSQTGFMNILPDGQPSPLCGGTPISGNITYYTTDGSYLRLDIQHDSDANWMNNPWTLSLPDGTRVSGGAVPNSAAFQRIIDRNGNFIDIINITANASYNNHQTTTIKDQLGREIILEYFSATEDRIHVSGVGGQELVWKVQWREITVRKNYHYSSHEPNKILTRVFKVVDKIILPTQANSLSYTFDYNATLNNAHPSVGWGELKSILLPSGASAAYEYKQDSTNGSINNPLFPYWILRNRPKKKILTYTTVYDGVSEVHNDVWQYDVVYHNNGSSVDDPVTETITIEPDGGVSKEYPRQAANNGAYIPEETGKTINPDGTVVERVYNYNPPSGAATLNTANRFVKYEFTSVPNQAGTALVKTAMKEYSYDLNGNVLMIKEYDWVNYGDVPRDQNSQQLLPTGLPSPAPAAVRVTVNDYHLVASGGNRYNAPNSPLLRNAIKSSKVQDGSGTVFSYSEFTYDSFTTTGNLTQSKIWDSNKGALPLTNPPPTPPAQPNYILITNQYDSYGNVTSTFDGKGYQTRFTYDTNDLYPIKIEKAYGTPVQLTTDKVYDFSTGLETQIKDVDNNVKTTMTYDDFGRPKLVKAAEGEDEETRTETIYDDVARYVIVKSDLKDKGDKKLVSITHYDQLGRVRLKRTLEDAATESETDESTGIKVQMRYRFSAPYSYTLTSNPYRAATASAANQEETMGWTLSKAHNNGRSSEVESFDGVALPQPWGNNTTSTGKVITGIDANTTTVTDQTGKKRRSVVDGLGRLIRVDETSGGAFDGSNGPLQPTRYSYDVLDNLIKVEQPTQTTPVVTQTRRFAYDSLKRLIFAANPEQATHSLLANWAVKYEYDNNSNLTKKTDSRELSATNLLTITYTYDELNRIRMRSYANDPQNTPMVIYDYDDSNVEFAQGRLTKVTTQGISTTEYLKYDRLGRILQSKQTTNTPDGNKDYSFSYEYNRAGALTREVYPSGKAVATEYDPAGRVAGVKKEGGDYYVGAIATDTSNRIRYTAHGAIKAMKLGNGLWEHTNFNGRLQPIQIGLGTNTSNSGTVRLDYTYGTTNNNGNVLSQQIVVGTMDVTQSYEYDELNRLQRAEEKATANASLPAYWKQTFTYDRFGNRKFDTSPTATFPASVLGAQLDFSANSNRITSSNYHYDNAGNVKQEPASPTNKSYAYDGENHQVSYSFNGTTTHYVYDGEGHRVMKWDNTGAIVYVYDGLGRLAAEYTTSASQNNGISYLTTDHLGSTRVVTNGSGAVKARYDYLPFGEEVPSGLGGRNYLTDNTRQKFTGHERDPETKLDFAQARYCSSATGRFMSPDDFLNDTSAVDPASWNLYVYVRNNPLRYVDPSGEKVYVGGLNQTEQDELLRRINYTYGCQNCVSIDQDGYLTVNTSNLSQAVSSATQYLTDAINSDKNFFEVRVTNNNSQVAFGDSQAGAGSVQRPGNKNRSSAVLIRLDFADDRWVSGGEEAKEVFLNTVFAHEIAHFYPKYLEDPKNSTDRGAVVDVVNEILLATGRPLRAIYNASVTGTHWATVSFGIPELDKNTRNVLRDKDVNSAGFHGVRVKVDSNDKVIRWVKSTVGGTGVN